LNFLMSNDNRGLASADEKTRKRVASEGGKAPHDERGLEAADEETKERVAKAGGKASHSGGRK
jgi:general stress protein YciG